METTGDIEIKHCSSGWHATYRTDRVLAQLIGTERRLASLQVHVDDDETISLSIHGDHGMCIPRLLARWIDIVRIWPQAPSAEHVALIFARLDAAIRARAASPEVTP